MDLVALTSGEATLAAAGIAFLGVVVGAALTHFLAQRRAKQEAKDAGRREAERRHGAENRRVVRDQYLGLTARLAAELEAVYSGAYTNVDHLQEAYAAVQAAGRADVVAAFGTGSAVQWAERRVRAILDGGRQVAFDILNSSDPEAAKARYFNFITPILADKLLDDVFRPEADAAIAQPGRIVTEFVSPVELRDQLDARTRELGGHPVQD